MGLPPLAQTLMSPAPALLTPIAPAIPTTPPVAQPVRPVGPSRMVLMKGFPAGTTEARIREIMMLYGTVVGCVVQQAGDNTIAGLLCMKDEDEAQWIVNNLSRARPSGTEFVLGDVTLVPETSSKAGGAGAR